MAAQTNVGVLKEVSLEGHSGWRICLQWCTYFYPEDEPQSGYRFIWRRPESGALQAARGQARLPSLTVAKKLMAMAESAGWSELAADDVSEFD